MRVRDIMTAAPVIISATAGLTDAVSLMILKRVGALPVVDDQGSLCGIISEGDLLHRSELGTTKRARSKLSDWFSPKASAHTYRMANSRKVTDLMSKPAIVIDDTDTIDMAADLMDKHRIKHLPVLDHGRLVGILSRFDLMRALRMFIVPAYEEQATSDEEIRIRILRDSKCQTWADHCDIGVYVSDGCVTLDGTVGSDDQRIAFGILAENVVGVRSVVNEIVLLEPMMVPLFS